MTVFRRGCFYWGVMADEGKRRPLLVLSNDVRNDRSPTVVVVPCTSVKRFGPWHVELRKGEGGLPQGSVVKCEDVTMIPKSKLVPGALGGLTEARLTEIRDALLNALDFQ